MGSDQVGIKLGTKHVRYILQRKRINLITDMKQPSLANNCVYRPEYNAKADLNELISEVLIYRHEIYQRIEIKEQMIEME